jgi:DNA repair protein RecO (recombination protein O)
MTDLRTRSLVLRRTNYGEADRIVQLITPEGKRSVMVKGARREKSKLAGGIELLVLGDITIHDGKGELGVLTSARIVKFYGKILQDYDRLQFAYEAMKLVARGSEHIDSPEFFGILTGTFEGLDSAASIDLVQAWFYLRLAKVLGEELNLGTDADGEKLNSTTVYIYDVDDQAFRASEYGGITADHIKLLRVMTHNDLNLVRKVTGVESLLPEVLNLAKTVAKL